MSEKDYATVLAFARERGLDVDCEGFDADKWHETLYGKYCLAKLLLQDEREEVARLKGVLVEVRDLRLHPIGDPDKQWRLEQSVMAKVDKACGG